MRIPFQRWIAGKAAVPPSGAAGASFVTISRQAGACGHELAEALLDRMEREKGDPLFSGWAVFDKEICAKVLEDGKLRVSLQALMAENHRTAAEDYVAQLIAGAPAQYAVYSEIFKTVRAIAFAGKAIIVGRAAACYTRDIPGGVHLRLVAPEKTRVAALARRDGVPAAQARRRAAELDRSRAGLAAEYFKKDISDPLLYDAVWNVQTVPIETVSAQTVALLKSRAAAAPPRGAAGALPASAFP